MITDYFCINLELAAKYDGVVDSHATSNLAISYVKRGEKPD